MKNIDRTEGDLKVVGCNFLVRESSRNLRDSILLYYCRTLAVAVVAIVVVTS